MTEDDDREHLEFAERVRSAYHATPVPAAGASRRILAAIERRRVRGEDGPWWLRSRTVTVRPVAVVAAGLVLVALGAVAAWQLPRPGRTGPAPRVASLDPHAVRFVFADPAASSVSLVGDFNGWDRHATPLAPGPVAGYWSVSVRLPAGWHSYAFVVDGTRWMNDPLAPLAPADDLGPPRSVVVVKGGA